ncbi:MAG: hypothetical protein HY598_05420 [Candidatus Omnitrophica bacterium]|nr:hypothetical protein [Candidatus Omnitrophota bacterium]
MSPDGSTRPSPEERLLRLIRAKGPAASQVTPARQAASAAVGSGVSVAQTPLRWPVLVGGALTVVLAAELVYLLLQLARPLPSVQIPPLPEIPAAAPAGELPPPVDVPQLAGSVLRPLFVSSLVAAPSDAAAPSAGAAPSVKAKDLVARLTLMGIVAGDPAQAIIEDAETKKTYFVTTGQAVTEGAVLEEVLENRVILSLNGERITLSL